VSTNSTFSSFAQSCAAGNKPINSEGYIRPLPDRHQTLFLAWATVLNSIRLADETLVGSGSVVIKNTKPCSKNVGNPSRVIIYHREEGVRMKEREG